jgi:hypothetical protein
MFGTDWGRGLLWLKKPSKNYPKTTSTTHPLGLTFWIGIIVVCNEMSLVFQLGQRNPLVNKSPNVAVHRLCSFNWESWFRLNNFVSNNCFWNGCDISIIGMFRDSDSHSWTKLDVQDSIRILSVHTLQTGLQDCVYSMFTDNCPCKSYFMRYSEYSSTSTIVARGGIQQGQLKDHRDNILQ